jgi:hypothetical protein
MNKSSLLLLFFLTTIISFFPDSAQGQLYSRPGIGFKAGYGLSDLYGKDVNRLAGDVGPKFGFVGGVFLRFRIKESLTIEPELLYSIKGVKRDGTYTDTVPDPDTTYYGTVKTQLTYMEIPVLVKFHFPSPLGITPNVFGGPFLAFRQTGKVVFTNDRLTLETAIDQNVAKTDFGLVIGAGVNFLFGTGQIVTELRYTRGFISVDGSGRGLNAYNHSLAFMAGFIFHFTRPFGK